MLDLRTYTSPLLVSGTSATVLKLGDKVESAPQLNSDTARRRYGRAGDLSQQLSGDGGTSDAAAAGGSGAAASKSKVGSNIAIKDLIDAGLIKPGPTALTVTYKNKVTVGALLADGNIEYSGQTFSSPSAFSVHVKRQQTPGKQGDDGWRSVHAADSGASLHDLRASLLSALGQQAVAAAGGGAGRQRGRPARAKPATYKEEDALEEEEEEDGAPAAAAAAEPAEVHWVQCSRCERWRVVPDEHWAAIDAADEDADWFCEMAPWDVSKFEPFDPACPTG